jgi:hypothetical protein
VAPSAWARAPSASNRRGSTPRPGQPRGASSSLHTLIVCSWVQDGVRTLVLHVADTEAALGRLKQGGFRIVEFPKYLVRPQPLLYREAGAHVLK